MAEPAQREFLLRYVAIPNSADVLLRGECGFAETGAPRTYLAHQEPQYGSTGQPLTADIAVRIFLVNQIESEKLLETLKWGR